MFPDVTFDEDWRKGVVKVIRAYLLGSRTSAAMAVRKVVSPNTAGITTRQAFSWCRPNFETPPSPIRGNAHDVWVRYVHSG